jgi:hypothetical protein
MNIGKLSLILFLVVIIGMGWGVYSYFHPNYEKCYVENNEFFQSNILELNDIVENIKRLDLEKTNNISVEELPVELKNKLQKFGIGSFSYIDINDDKCNDGYTLEFNVVEYWNIEKLGNVKLIYSPCDKNTKLDCHFYDGYHIDSWGQGYLSLIHI